MRRQQVALLERMRDKDTLDSGATDRGLQGLLRRFLIRNTKSQNERRYFMGLPLCWWFRVWEFRKLDDDLQQRVGKSSLVPFEGEHTPLTSNFASLIQEVTEPLS